MHLADIFIQSDVKTKQLIKEPTIIVVHNVRFIRQLDYKTSTDDALK